MSNGTGSTASMNRMKALTDKMKIPPPPGNEVTYDEAGYAINPDKSFEGSTTLPTFNVVYDKDSDTTSTSVGDEKKARSIKKGKLKQRFKQMKVGKRVSEKLQERQMAKSIKKGKLQSKELTTNDVEVKGGGYTKSVKKLIFRSDKEKLEINKYKKWLKKNNLKDSHKNRENFN
ncbi:hypothetical protein H8D85_00145 [bacterium]|nr:hypothetical protein [bacterium]